MDGLPEQAIELVSFRDLRVVSRDGIRISEARGLRFENVSLTTWQATELMTFTNVRDVSIRNATVSPGTETFVLAKGTSAGIRIVGGDLSGARTAFRLESGIAADAVCLEPAQK
jgi:hypothetical protein